MPTETVVIVAIILGAFVAFAAALAWGDYATGRHRSRRHPAE